ncbi:PREDICTED: histone-lysine N-methyltransferase SETD1B-like [Ipomoea nil]|uniref:histone-lysine N-methyltransferase SETD1B-like n=1 Tax=Ipomoea nil TaxID=35883 RepID=UPI000901A009|nr:PREDICTED: histone-lysine N-methyltransferase SETD1B-like [Ipomoea nil]
MKEEEKFALEWVGTKDVYEALRLEKIRRVYSYKVTNRTLGKDKNDPNCEGSGSKDENGKEISDESDKEKEDEANEDTDDADADNENDDDDDADDDDNQNGGNTNNPHQDHNAANPEESSSHNSPSRSDDKREASLKADETSHTQPEDLSRAIVPHVQPMDETPIKREDAIPREDKMDASPVFISSASGGKMEAPPQAEQMDTSPTNIEEESPPVSPHHVMNLMRETIHTAEIIHREYLTLRRRDTQTLEDLSKKVDQLMAAQAQSHPPPHEQPQPPPQAPPEQQSNIHLAKELHELHASVDKVAKQQHELKHSHFSLKERVDLACKKMETAHDNTFQMDTLAAINKLSTPPTTCADDAKKGEKKNPDDKDDDHPRDNTRNRSDDDHPRDNTRNRSPSFAQKDSERRSTYPPPS